MTSIQTGVKVQRLDRRAIQPHLPQLDAWLLPDAFYGVQQTWPQLYRSDGSGCFYAVFEDDRLVSHCAVRVVLAHGQSGVFRCALLGSVATAPDRRGSGLASAVLTAALADLAADADQVLLWAERPCLYERHGFAATEPETMLMLARRPHPDLHGVREAVPADHAALQRLHTQKPWRIERTQHDMSGLLTTPGLHTLIRERNGRIVAYACCGKGADLHDTWHEVGGDDAEVARLLQAGLHVLGQTHAAVLQPPYRTRLAALLGASLVELVPIPGPMAYSYRGEPPVLFVDGLDSV